MSDFDKLTKMLALEGCIQPVNALQEINSSDFVLKTSTDNIEALMDVNYIRPYLNHKDYNSSLKQIEKLVEAQHRIGIKNKCIKETIFDFVTSQQILSEVYEKYMVLNKEIEDLEQKEQQLKNTYVALEFLKNVSMPLEEITIMKNFQMDLYKVPVQNMLKLKANYENIPSIIESVLTEKEFIIFISFTPILLLIETERIFKSANCEKIEVPNHYLGTAKDSAVVVSSEIKKLQQSTWKIQIELNVFLR